ncbi:MAG: STAS/SEC14 domain-containing protein [bacterium]
MITVEHHHENFLVIRASGRLTGTDYDAALPELEHAMSLAPGRPNLLVVLEDFHGWEPEALWKDLRFDLKHYRDFGRIAVVGESAAGKWLTKISTLFMAAEIRYFSRERMDEAEQWLREAGQGAAPSVD